MQHVHTASHCSQDSMHLHSKRYKNKIKSQINLKREGKREMPEELNIFPQKTNQFLPERGAENLQLSLTSCGGANFILSWSL